MATSEKLLRTIGDAFSDLADSVNSPTPHIDIDKLVRACRLVSTLIGYLGVVFMFAVIEFDSKVANLAEASKSIDTLETLLDHEIEQNLAKISYSHSRHLIRVKRSIDMLRLLFEQILFRGGNSIKGPMEFAYMQVFGPYHGWAVQTAVLAAIPLLPTKAKLLDKLNEDEASAVVPIQNFVDAATCVSQYIESLFLSRESVADLLGLI